MVQLSGRKEGEDADNFLKSAEKVLSARDPALGRLCPLEHSETLRGGTLLQQPASGLREADSVYTCHEGGGRRRKPERSPKLLHSGRPGENPGAQLGAGGRRGAGRATAAGRARLALLGRARDAERRATLLQALPAAFRTRGEEQSPRRSSQAGTRADVGRCSRPGRLAGPGPPHPRSAAAALTWLVPGGRDGHGSAARGGTSSPGKDRLLGH